MRFNGRICLLLAAVVVTPATAQAQEYSQVVQNLSVKLSVSLKGASKQQVAVVDFTDLQGNVTELGRFIAEEFSIALTTNGVPTIDRTHLKAILAEHKLASSGIIDPQTARQLGQLAGVDALVTGTLTPFGESVRLAVKVLDVSTARVVDASTGDLPRTKAIDELINRNISSSPAPSRPGTSALSDLTNDPPVIAVAAGLQFELTYCGRNTASVICVGWITNKGDDTPFALWGSAAIQAWDDLGNEYQGTRAVIANKTMGTKFDSTIGRIVAARLDMSQAPAARGAPAPGGVSNGSVTLISGIRTQFSMEIVGRVLGGSFSRLVLHGYTNAAGFFDVMFKSVPIHETPASSGGIGSSSRGAVSSSPGRGQPPPGGAR